MVRKENFELGVTVGEDEEPLATEAFVEASVDGYEGGAPSDGGGEAELTNYAGVETEDLTLVGEVPTEEIGLDYAEWSQHIDGETSGSSGPRLRPQIDGELKITGATVNAMSSGDSVVQLKEINSDDTHGSVVDSSTFSVTEGLNDIEFDITFPATGDDYVMVIGDSSEVMFDRISSSAGESAGIDYPLEGDMLSIMYSLHPDGYVGPRNAYQTFFNIQVEETEIPTSNVTYEKGIKELDYEGVTIVENGQELYDTAHNARAGTHVRLKAANEYIVPDEIWVNEGVIIDGNHAEIVPSGDHNVFFLEDKTTLKDIRVSLSDLTYTSDVIQCDTDRYGDTYHGSGQSIELRAVITGNSSVRRGCGFRVKVGESAWFSVQQDISLKISGMGSAIRFDVDGPHANGCRIEAHLWGNRVNLHKTGNGNFASRFVGEMDGTSTGADGGTEYLLLNEGPDSARASTFYGFLWDKFHATEGTIEGKWHIVAQNRVHTDLPDTIGNASGIFQWFENGELGWYDMEYNNAWRFRWANDRMEFACDPDGERNFSDWMQYRPDTDQLRVQAEIVANQLWLTGGHLNLGSGAGISKNSNGDIIATNEDGDSVNLNNL